MQTIQILDIKAFMQLLFQTNYFDLYDFVSAQVKTDLTYTIDGHIHLDFFTEEEQFSLHTESSPFIHWQTPKEKIFNLIKGKKTPSFLKIVLKLSPELTGQLLENTQSNLTLQDIDGMFLNILFQDHSLSVICGISYKLFTLEKKLEKKLSTFFTHAFRQNNITVEQ